MPQHQPALDFHHLRSLREWQIRESETYLFTFQSYLAESFGNLRTNLKTFRTWASLVAADALTTSISIINSYEAVKSSPSSTTSTDNAFTSVVVPSSSTTGSVLPNLKSTVVGTVARPSPPKLYNLTSPPATPESPPGPPRLDYGGIPSENFDDSVNSVKASGYPNFESSTSPTPTRFNNARGYLSEVKNSFGPRQSNIIEKKSRALPQPSSLPSWRDL